MLDYSPAIFGGGNLVTSDDENCVWSLFSFSHFFILTTLFSFFLDSAQYGDTITSINVRYWTHSISEKKSKYLKEKMTEKYAKFRRRKCRKSRRQKIRQNNSVESGRRRTRTELEHMYLRYNVHDSAVLHQYLISSNKSVMNNFKLKKNRWLC